MSAQHTPGLLTKPQERLLWRAMKGNGRVNVSGARWRTAHSLVAKGFLEFLGYEEFRVNLAGLEALGDFWMRKDAASGCIAYQQHRQTVEAAIAEIRGAL